MRTQQTNLFGYLLLLTSFFVLLEVSFFIQCNQAYLSDFTFVSDKLSIPSAIYPAMVFFVLAQMGIHLGYCLIVWLLARLINPTLKTAIMIWMLGLCTIFTANQYYFPNSKFADLSALILFTPGITHIVFIILLTVCAALLLLALKRLTIFVSMTAVAVTALMLGIAHYTAKSPPIRANTKQPNIIIVGMDSLRPDFLGYFATDNHTPFLDSLLNDAVVFSEAVTPLARTFPSWSSILTGQYPKQLDIRFNLSKQGQGAFSDSLPAILQRHGYHTVYATDETRFSNVDKNYGFNEIVTPPIGLNDFLLGTFNDFPMSNLLVNTRLGKWLFPYSYANRPVFFTYQPDSFLKLLQPALNKDSKKPLFLAVHFCLTHQPYVWGGLPANHLNLRERYAASVQGIDMQVQAFFALLKQEHVLDHAIVVLLSDHGEALELDGDRLTEANAYLGNQQHIPRFYPPSLDKEAVNQSAGHGTDVLGLPQYHVLLAFKLYGLTQSARLMPGVVSLLDIKPTILQLIGVQSKTTTAGYSLAPLIHGSTKAIPDHHDIFLESDYSPEAIRTVFPETRKVMLEGIQLFKIDPVTTRLIVKDSMAEMIIRSKQYADIHGEWMLAVYPQDHQARMPVLINLNSGAWTTDLHSAFAKQSPANLMMARLKAFYGDEI